MIAEPNHKDFGKKWTSNARHVSKSPNHNYDLKHLRVSLRDPALVPLSVALAKYTDKSDLEIEGDFSSWFQATVHPNGKLATGRNHGRS